LVDYHIDIPKHWKIHPTISVAHLEPAKHDTYERALPPPPDLIHDNDGTSHEEWEVESIIRSRWKDKKNKKNKEYYIKWKGYGPEHNSWVLPDDLKNSPDLIREFESKSPLIAFASTIITLPGSNLATWSNNLAVLSMNGYPGNLIIGSNQPMAAIFLNLGLQVLYIDLVTRNNPMPHFGQGICQLQIATIA